MRCRIHMMCQYSNSESKAMKGPQMTSESVTKQSWQHNLHNPTTERAYHTDDIDTSYILCIHFIIRSFYTQHK